MARSEYLQKRGLFITSVLVVLSSFAGSMLLYSVGLLDPSVLNYLSASLLQSVPVGSEYMLYDSASTFVLKTAGQGVVVTKNGKPFSVVAISSPVVDRTREFIPSTASAESVASLYRFAFDELSDGRFVLGVDSGGASYKAGFDSVRRQLRDEIQLKSAELVFGDTVVQVATAKPSKDLLIDLQKVRLTGNV